MARYDSPGYQNLGPAGPVHQSTVAGSGSGSPQSYPVADPASRPLIVALGMSLPAADLVSVGPDDTQVPRQTDLFTGTDANPLSEVSGDAVGHTTPDPYGVSHVHPRNPNAGRNTGAGSPS
jgi:hypothetical protein